MTDPLRGLHDRRVYRLHGKDPVRVPPCPVCDGDRARPLYEVERVHSPVVVCDGCGLGYFHPMLDLDEIAASYPSEYYGAADVKFRSSVEWLVRFVGERHIAFLSRGLGPGAAVLDMGCGRGVLVGPLADRGFRTYGVERSAEAVRGADSRADIRIAPTLRDAAFEAVSFDQVVIWHVLEHLPDPRGTLLECYRILRPGGRLIVAVPNFSSWQARFSGPAWFHLDPPRHLFHFPVSAVRRLLARCGFRCGATHHFSLRQNPFGWIQSALNFTSFPRNALYTLLHSRGNPGARPFSLRTRMSLWTFFVLASPPALALSIAEAVMRRGGTVHVVARRPEAP